MKSKRIIVYIIGLVIAVFRIVVTKTSVETDTGFYIKGSVLPVVFTALVVAGIVGIAIIALMSRGTKYNSRKLKGGMPLCAAYVLMGALMLVCAYFYFADYRITNSIYVLLLLAASLAGGICTVLMGIYHTSDIENPSLSLLTIGTIFWFCISLIGIFKEYTTIITISNNILTALTMTVSLLFIFYSSKSQVDDKLYAKLTFTGLCSYWGAIITFVPNIWFWLSGDNVYNPTFKPDLVVFASLAVFAPIMLSVIDKGVNVEKE